MRTTYIHIGTHKTATTSIQGTLRNGREALERKGFLYPRAGVPAQFGGHHNIAWELLGSVQFRAEDGGIDDLLEEVRRSQRDVVLSAEAFSVAAHDPERFRSFVVRLKQHTPRVVLILYLRNQVDYARSLYLQLLRGEYRETFADFLAVILRDRMIRLGEGRRLAFCYRSLLALLPHDEAEIIVRSYDRTRPGTVADFLSILALKLDDLDIATELGENPSLPLADAVLNFYRNRRGPPDARLVDCVQRTFAGRSAELAPVSRQRLVAAFDSSNRFVSTRYGCALAGAAPATASDGLFLEDVFSEATLLLLDAIADACARIAQTESDRDAAVAACAGALDRAAAAGAERDRFAAMHGDALRDRDELAAGHANVLAERDALLRERNRIASERDSVAAEHEGLGRAHRAVAADRDAMLRSRSWRLTAPLRRIRGLLREPHSE